MPRDRGRRRRVAQGIYRDAKGLAAVVAVGSGADRRQREKRFPFGTKTPTMQAWRTVARAALLLQRRTPKARGRTTTGTLAAAVQTYLPTIRSRACYTARCAELAAWVEAFGPRSLETLAPLELQQQLEDWHAADLAASTLNHRISSLVALFAAVRPAGPNPAKDLRRYREPDPAPRALPYPDVEAILAAMVSRSTPRGTPPGVNATQACCRVLAYTGLPFVRLARLKPEHLDLEAKRVWLEGRQKGKGTKARVLPLTARGTEAMRAWMAAGMIVPTSATRTIVFSRAVRAVNRARAKARAPLLPADVRPYDFRHTFGTWVYAQTRDIRATAALLDCTVDTAMRYARAALETNVAAIIAGLDETWGA